MHWFPATLRWQRWERQPADRSSGRSSSPPTPPAHNSLRHRSHGAREGEQVVAAQVDLRQRGNVTNGQRKLAEVVVRQVEAPQAREPGNTIKEKGICSWCEVRDINPTAKAHVSSEDSAVHGVLLSKQPQR